MQELKDHAHVAHLWPTAQHGNLSPGLWAFLASVSIVRVIKSLWIDRSKIWHNSNSSWPYLNFTACSEVKVHTQISKVQIFVIFILHAERACEICEICPLQCTFNNTVQIANLSISMFYWHTLDFMLLQSSCTLHAWPSLVHVKNSGSCYIHCTRAIVHAHINLMYFDLCSFFPFLLGWEVRIIGIW